MIEWLLAPIDSGRIHDVGLHLSWHARTMVLAWGVLVPLGIVAARYFKVLPWQDWPNELDNQTWWYLHRGAQYSALVLMAVGLWLILEKPTTAQSATGSLWIHRAFGWTTLALAVNQFVSGWLRGTKGGPSDKRGQMRGDHYDMTKRRVIFEHMHKTSGYCALGCAMITIMAGLWQANAPNFMWLGLIAWWGVLAALVRLIASRLERITTYEAIWGPDASPPQG